MKKKSVVVLGIILLVIFLAAEFFTTRAVSLKCASELNKMPPETRDLVVIEKEKQNFDACMKSFSWFDKIRYGLLP